MEAPEPVATAHRSFARAGAEVLTTNYYAVVRYHFGDDLFASHGAALVDLSARLARQLADESDRPIRVAGWVADGASIVGGCCDMYPEHIAALVARLR
ncbi:MAG: homocysteine S-methyltransferase family protein [Acidimicrobiia bacterium]|nr:homocysteine S-methyltransferase family protein [Acidimicrobiia bacterium]